MQTDALRRTGRRPILQVVEPDGLRLAIAAVPPEIRARMQAAKGVVGNSDAQIAAVPPEIRARMLDADAGARAAIQKAIAERLRK